ncbi:hypothetical protein C8R48DRAFT_676100 [Suillus tomentosus]|nr:hypothetical protein C8R48DRAFT_676100 [Suillus tomentosus]
MVATEWTSKEQKEWLTGYIPAYSKCSTKASYVKFWPPVYEAWEQKWPIHKELWPDLPEDEALNAVQSDVMENATKKRQKQLRMWVSWHSGRSASCKSRVAQLSTRATHLLKDILQPRGARALSEPEMYSWLYYKTRIHPSVEAAISEYVKVRMKGKKKSKKSNRDGDSEDDDTLEDHDDDNEEGELTTEDVLEFSFLVLMGGPDPSNNNKISVSSKIWLYTMLNKLGTYCATSVDVGTTRLGHSAPQCLPDFKENFLGTYLRFLQDVQGYTSPEPEDKGEHEGDNADTDEDEDEDNVDFEDQDKVDVDPFADELEDELVASKGQAKGDGLDGQQGGKQEC